MPRIFSISDLHVDFSENMEHMQSLSSVDYQDDTLLIAGDVCDCMDKLAQLLTMMKHKFRQVTFVPGNHELWLRDGDIEDSLEKFSRILELCDQLGVHIRPFRVGENDVSVWVVPLYSWYRTEDSDEYSLFIAKEGEDWEKSPWMDKYFCRWAEGLNADSGRIADHFLDMNQENIECHYDAPVISFSHFLPRKELIFDQPAAASRFCSPDSVIPRYPRDPAPHLNFTRVAGCGKLDGQIRHLGAAVHVYGHQHHQRNRRIAGVTYVSNCLGYARERDRLGGRVFPRMLWQDSIFIQPDDAM